jgi:hypothetical protein
MVWYGVMFRFLGCQGDFFNAVDLVGKRSFSYIHILRMLRGVSLAVWFGQRALLGSLPGLDSIN